MIYAIRCKSIRKPWPKAVTCPFVVGAFMHEVHYMGPSLRTVDDPCFATFYPSAEEALAQITARASFYAATFEVVAFKPEKPQKGLK